ncbi:phosphoribosylaminoimidazole-succinocarboxamide synthase [Pedobacter sp. PACM 27299]|uniref:phosphoribosylaminoimidazolesuccinocarboxamide synthase n=1 Tax=Pedobacter sp. PACM 27299 TaxID=1727164 RepID=UPI000705E12A|nr:phosphoribosylaminoimidazolesuccinocarboxamide synthase [Pedobacter sp. PACM 27299]ALL05650.1 phosphoribosylaminoimidazole-succinocarboxamide synthase [Pedobacter sp. PACM 27299]
MTAIKETNFSFPKQSNFYKGKVRDVYTINNQFMAMVVTDRISAFDVVLPEAVPFKGQVLNQIAAKFLNATKDIVQNWVIDVPDEMVTIGRICEPFKVEMVVRGYLAGHAWREYSAGKRSVCGVALPEGLKENDQLPQPIITPTTKAAVGHDEEISRADILAKGIVSVEDYTKLEAYTLALYARGTEMAAERGLILVDTKYEFGKVGTEIFLIDEIHTPDSSRYFYAEGYAARQDANEPQKQLSKEFVRKWLIENGFQGKDGQAVPVMTLEIVNSISERYIELYEQITGDTFVKNEASNVIQRIEANVTKSLNQLLGN